MKIHLLITFIISVLFISCGQNTRPKGQAQLNFEQDAIVIHQPEAHSDSTENNFADTIEVAEETIYSTLPKIEHHYLWDFNAAGDTIYPVFQISPQSVGLVYTLGEERHEHQEQIDFYMDVWQTDSVLDYLYGDRTPEMIANPKVIAVDTLTELRLYSNKKITRYLQRFLNKQFYVYGTKGQCTVKINDIVFFPDDCRTNFALLRFDKNALKDIGKALIACELPIDLEYGEFTAQQTAYNKYLNKQPRDFADNGHIVLFARYNNNYYLGYRDNFKLWEGWGSHDEKDAATNIFFPYRGILLFENDVLTNSWIQEIDLFGAPCL